MRFGPDCRKSALLRDIRPTQQRLAELADLKSAADSIAAAPPIDLFLAGLRTAWKEGASRQTDRPIFKASDVVVALIRSFPDPTAAEVVQGRALAKRRRTPVEVTGGISGRVPGQAAANASAPPQILAQRVRKRAAVRMGGSCGADRHTDCAVTAPASGPGKASRCATPASSTTGLPRDRPSVFLGAKYMRQRSRPREHPSTRQYALSL